MKAECQNTFMIRTPNLPIKYLEEYKKQEKDIYEFIKQDKDLERFFQKALLISSPDIYRSYLNKPKDEKKYNNLKESLFKYFLRSVGRPTPYGYLASVAMGKFGEGTRLKRGRQILDVRVDNDWINQVIQKLENQNDVHKNLKVRYNPICYVSGDRVKNPYFTCAGNAEKKDKVTTENSIRYTNLIDLVREEARQFISWNELSMKIRQVYRNVSEKVIEDTLTKLLKSEYLLSNLRVPAYCRNALEHVIHELKAVEYKGIILKSLENILVLIQRFCKNESVEVLLQIYDEMERIVSSKNYLILNTGNEYAENILDDSVKKQVERLSELLYKIPVISDATHKLREKFEEVYGRDVEVPLAQIIDKNGFDGEKLVELENTKSVTEEKIVAVINNKVQQALLNQKEEVCFTEADFQDVFVEGIRAGTFDINLLITGKEKEHQLWLGPNFGAGRAGAMAQRFSECLPAQMFQDYNRLFQKERDNYKDYEIVELREFRPYGSQENVLNVNQNCDYCMTLGTYSEEREENQEITIEDVYIGLSETGAYAYSKRLGKKLKFVVNNMLNPNLNSGISKLLLGISREYESSPLDRLSMLSSELSYKCLPRILFENVIVLPRKWLLDELDLAGSSYEKFKQSFLRCRELYKLDSNLYYVSADNRIIVDLDAEEYLSILYHEFKKRKRLEFSELEANVLRNPLVTDCKEDTYINECVFSIMDVEKRGYASEEMGVPLCEENRRKLLCEDGWVYFKLYGTGNRDNEILTVQMPELLETLGHPKHFFIRYADQEGEHLRVRVKFTKEEAYKGLSKINIWSADIMEKKCINHITFETYFREINRYGGKELIDLCEEVFFQDSLTVEKILRCYDMERGEDLERVYITGITFLLKGLTCDLEEMFQVVDSVNLKTGYRKEYREGYVKYLKYIQAVLDENVGEYVDAQEEYAQEKAVLGVFAEQLRKQIENGKNTNGKENIILSIIHMHCNRMTGNRIYENKYLSIVRHGLYQILQKKRHYMNGISRKEVV